MRAADRERTQEGAPRDRSIRALFECRPLNKNACSSVAPIEARREPRESRGSRAETIAELVSRSGEVSVLESALSKCSSLANAVEDERQRLTVFAPTNRAFEAALNEFRLTPKQFLARSDVCEILSLHVSGEEINPRRIRDGERIPTLLKDDRGRPLEIEAVVSGRGADEMLEWKVGDVTSSTRAVVFASNGIIVAIDKARSRARREVNLPAPRICITP